MIPQIGLGTYKLSGDDVVPIVKAALAAGYRHIDTAEFYGNEKRIGEAIAGFPREQLFITSKVWPTHLRYDDVVSACEQTLADLGTAYLDLYLVHWPNSDVPMEETFRALEELKRQGAIRAFGVSNFTVEHLEKAVGVTKGISAHQFELHPWFYRKDLVALCEKNGIAVTAYAPLARGQLLADPAVLRIAQKHSKTAAQVCLRWGVQHGWSVIPKTTSKERLKENFAIDFRLDNKDMAVLDSLPQQRIVPQHFS